MEVQSFIANENKLKKLYYICSEDNYLREEFKQKFIDKFVDEEIKDFNLSFVQPGEDYLKRLKSAVQTPPLGSEKRFVISHLEAADSFDKKEAEKFIALLENLAESTSLLILSPEPLDKRKKLYLRIKKQGSYHEFKAPKYSNLDKWIVSRFREYNKKIDKRSIKVLENMFSNKLEILAAEIEKIVTRFPDKEKISYYDIKDLISRERFIEDEEIFAFLDLIGEKKTDKALLSLKEMLNKGVYPLYLLTMLANQIELLMQVKFYSQFTKNNKEIAKKINKHPYPVKKALQRSRNFTQLELEKILEEILTANYHFLTGYYPDQNTALEMIIIKAINY
ncbi:DNA polymerase III subunit delta [Halanaerobium sp. Z-7514]|uniref:DNA polymerase III subunit delta n=1 Tax=Halanaerobium polyolivorans TaxID=2886943 RepID=A0AAW4X0T9_9FIRM|nr:DNA polymerase III subunit delta [Halanaerobium polyolivorans]MCC3145407.1 DNA polymerase III subunit delta [Halanaerobium polyolivorans]